MNTTGTPQLGPLAAAFVQQIIQPLVNGLFVVGILVFVWGVVEFLINLNSGKDSSKGKQHMLWGLVGVFIMAGVLGILQFMTTAICGGTISSCYVH